MRQIKLRDLLKVTAFFICFGYGLLIFGGNVVRGITQQQVVDRYDRIHTLQIDPVNFWLILIGSAVVTVVAAAPFILVLVVATSRLKNGDPVGSLKGRTGQSAAPLIDETKRSNK